MHKNGGDKVENPYDKLYEMIKNTAKAQVTESYMLGVVVSKKEDIIKRVRANEMEYASGEGELFVIGTFSYDKGDELLIIPMNDKQQALVLGKVNSI